MGWFSSKTIISVYSNVLPLADPDENQLAAAVLGAILRDQEILPAITALNFKGVASRINRMMDYAAEEYTLGLPNGGQSGMYAIPDATVATAIADNLNLPNGVVCDHNYTTNLSYFHILLPYLTETRGYNHDTGYCETFPDDLPKHADPGGPTVSYKTTGKTERLTIDAITLQGSITTTATYRIKYQFRTTFAYASYGTDWEGAPVTVRATKQVTTYYEEDVTINTTNAGYIIGDEYIVAQYYEKDGGGVPSTTPKWWYYMTSSGVYPTLDPPHNADEQNSLMPVVPLRYWNQDYTAGAHKNTERYRTSKEMMDIIGVDIDEISTELNKNADIAEIDHAYIMFGINLATDRNESIKYLTEFFDFLADQSTATQADYNAAITDNTLIDTNTYRFGRFTNQSGSTQGSYGSSSVVNTTTPVSLVENGLNIDLHYNWIESEIIIGSIGAVGTATKTLQAETAPSWWGDKTVRQDALIILRHQITPQYYKQVIVNGAQIVNHIYGNYKIVTTINDVIDDLAKPEADRDDNFVIPMHFGVSKRIDIGSRNTLYLEALHLIVQSIHFQEVKWYQRGVFKLFCSVVLVVIGAILTYFGQAWIGVPLMKMGAGMLFMEILTRIVPMDSLKILFYIYLVYSVYSMNWTALIDGTATAAEYLAAVTMAAEVSKIPIQIRHEKTMEEFEGLESQNEAKMLLLEEAERALDVKSYLDPMLLLDGRRYTPVLTATVDAFYDLKLWANPGIDSIHQMDYFHDRLLKLPDNTFES
jgi:hypothetical protein